MIILTFYNHLNLKLMIMMKSKNIFQFDILHIDIMIWWS